ncbi:MAG: hypothetical protein JWM19_6948 [Actinomycetia bacterium]|nr:hypothetical protein [Actinomycetes bacterium]
MKEALDVAGRDPAGLQVAGNLRAVLGADGRVDVAATLDPVPELAAAGSSAPGTPPRPPLPERTPP